MTNKFFVYGTLMSGCSNHHVIPTNSIEKIEPAVIENVELFAFLSGKFPCMINGNNKVVGELITIKKSNLKQSLKMMDRLEGYDEKNDDEDNLYIRELRKVKTKDDEINAYVYIFNSDKYLGSRIEEGDWKVWKGVVKSK